MTKSNWMGALLLAAIAGACGGATSSPTPTEPDADTPTPRGECVGPQVVESKDIVVGRDALCTVERNGQLVIDGGYGQIAIAAAGCAMVCGDAKWDYCPIGTREHRDLMGADDAGTCDFADALGSVTVTCARTAVGPGPCRAPG